MLRIVNPADSKHFRDRLFQRYGILITASEVWDLRDMLKGAKVLKREGSKATYLLKIKGKQVIAIYCNQSQRFITAPPMRSIF
jgi:hypothetical protein